MADGTRDVNVKEFWPHPEEGGLDAAVTRCFLGQLSELKEGGGGRERSWSRLIRPWSASHCDV